MPQIKKQGIKFYRAITSPFRALPDFIIIGAQRCGTTSLYSYLTQHPCITAAYKKEIHFFDFNFQRGRCWYRAHFPSLLSKYYYTKIRKQKFITGEASPYYIFYPHAPKRILSALPQIKLIILLRNPVDRAYSHYNHEIKLGVETLSFAEAIRKEKERLNGEKKKVLKDESCYSFNLQHYSYLSRGIYIDQLKIWFNFFTKEQILILKSEDFYNDTQGILKQIFKFLNLPSWEIKNIKKHNHINYRKINFSDREYLLKYFKPHNKKLYDFLGMDFAWH
jgi:hypothetical protein